MAKSQKIETPEVEDEEVPEFLATLRDEHRYFQSLLDIAREQQELLENKGDVDLDILQDVLQYLSEYPDDYHHPRENLMFTRLREVDGGSGRLLDRLLAGHHEMEKESNRLYFTVMRANNGENIRRRKLSEDLNRFVEGYEKHMDDEDNVIFLRALNALSDKDWAELDDGMEHVEDPLFGARVRRRYRHLANVLEARLGVAKRDLIAAEYLSLGALIDSMITISETTINISYILRDRTGQTLRENFATARDTVKSGKFVEIVKLPSRLNKNALDNVRDGFKETKDLVRKAAEDIRTPYNMRVDTLKDILREDFGS
ncbi:MAG: hemerythrin domain-containing protein [Gammaproteobacteria bacterium]|nr:hemerythrin domain-containing protein [Gammaproteobacteria bacterium]